MSDKPGKNPDTWLADESTVSRAYGELTQAGPPAHLDQQILAEARRAAASQDNTVVRVQRWRKWTMPVALAATVVFAVPLVIRVVENTPTRMGATQSAPAVAATNDAITESKTDASTIRAQASDQVSTGQRPLEGLLQQLESARKVEETGRLTEFRRASPEAPENLIASGRTDTDTGGDVTTTANKDVATTSDVPPTVYDDYPGTPPQPAADRSALDAVTQAKAEQGHANAPVDSDAGDAATSFADEEYQYGYADSPVPAAEPDTDADQDSQRRESAPAPSEISRTNSERSFAGGAAIVADEPAGPPATQMATTTAELEQDGTIEEVLLTGSSRRQDKWLGRIAKQYRRGQVRKARRELGSFLTKYPDYPLPDDFPLQKEDAIIDGADEGAEIVPEAASWLRGIGLMAERGDIDQARMQLADFFKIYPDYPLPADFPLTRADALPIER